MTSERCAPQDKRKSDFIAVILLVIIAFLFNLALSLSNFYNWNYDSWSHMFFASHYMNSWFDTWDTRWFGGMSVTSYPPLVTQLLALGGFVIGLENAYIVFSLLLMVTFPVAIYYFSRCFLSRQQATLAGLFSIVLPTLYSANYANGQLPTIFALVSTLFMGTFLWQYLDSGRVRKLLIASLLLGITAATHQFTFICFVPFFTISLCLCFFFSRRPDVRIFLKRLGIFLSVSIPLALIPIYPFWLFLINAVPQTPIDHFSRTNLFATSQTFVQLFLVPYLVYLLTIPLAVYSAVKHKSLIPLFVAFVLLFILGLGGTTPLPRFIFGQWWEWLTYDRFELWAGALLIPLIVKMVPSVPLAMTMKSLKPYIIAPGIILLLVMVISSAYFSTIPSRLPSLAEPNVVNSKPLVEFINSQDAGKQYRYITLGFGEAQSEKLSVLVHSGTLDGGYYTARTLPVLIESGIGMIDSSKFVDPDLKTLNQILAEADSYSLNWVLVNDTYYYDILEKNSFYLKWSAETSGDSRFGGVTIWTKDGVPSIVGESTHETGFSSYVWGVAPLLLFIAAILLLAWEIKDSIRNFRQYKPI